MVMLCESGIWQSGGSPIAGWFLLGKIPSRNGWGVPPFQDTSRTLRCSSDSSLCISGGYDKEQSWASTHVLLWLESFFWISWPNGLFLFLRNWPLSIPFRILFLCFCLVDQILSYSVSCAFGWLFDILPKSQVVTAIESLWANTLKCYKLSQNPAWQFAESAAEQQPMGSNAKAEGGAVLEQVPRQK